MGKTPSPSIEENAASNFQSYAFSRLIGRREARKIRTPQGFFRREGVTGGGPASGASARGTYGARATGRSDLTGHGICYQGTPRTTDS